MNKIRITKHTELDLKPVPKQQVLTCPSSKEFANLLNKAFGVVEVQNLTNGTIWKK